MPEFDSIEEDELQKRELQRLLSTAQDEERKEYIRKALSALESHEQNLSGKQDKTNPHLLNPSIHASVFANHGLPTIETRNARLRPVSARRRPSSSNLLDAIPESLHQSNRKEIEISAEEVAEVVSSSFDPKCPADSIFKHVTHGGGSSHSTPSHRTHFPHQITHSPSFSAIPENSSLDHSHSAYHASFMSSGGARHWVSTGLCPQFLSVTFYEKWLIKRIEVRCKGVEKIAVHINFSAASAFTPSKLIQLIKKNDDKFEAEVLRPRSSEVGGVSADEGQGVHGIGLLLVVQKASGVFCSISNVRVVVCPTSR